MPCLLMCLSNSSSSSSSSSFDLFSQYHEETHVEFPSERALHLVDSDFVLMIEFGFSESDKGWHLLFTVHPRMR